MQYEVSVMYIHEGHRCTCVPNMKFLCLILYLGEVCTDTNVDANDTDTNDARWTKHDCKGSLVVKLNEPKNK